MDRGMASRQNGWKRCSNARFELLWSRDPSLANSRHLQGKFLWSLAGEVPLVTWENRSNIKEHSGKRSCKKQINKNLFFFIRVVFKGLPLFPKLDFGL